MTLLPSYIREPSAVSLSDEFLKLVSNAAKLIGSIINGEYVAMLKIFERHRVH